MDPSFYKHTNQRTNFVFIKTKILNLKQQKIQIDSYMYANYLIIIFTLKKIYLHFFFNSKFYFFFQGKGDMDTFWLKGHVSRKMLTNDELNLDFISVVLEPEFLQMID